jgi:hypothetical protein
MMYPESLSHEHCSRQLGVKAAQPAHYVHHDNEEKGSK